MTSIWKNMHIEKLDDTVNKCNNGSHRTIKMKPVNVNPSTHIDFNKENNKEDSKFKVGRNIRISKYKKIFPIGYVLNWSEKFFERLKKLRILCCGHMLLVILM